MTKAIYDADLLVTTCRDWVAIGCNPLEKIECFKFSANGVPTFAFGMRQRGYSDEGAWVFESRERYLTRAEAIASIGRALDSESVL